MSIIVGFALDIVRGAREWVDSTRQLDQTGARGTTKKEGQS